MYARDAGLSISSSLALIVGIASFFGFFVVGPPGCLATGRANIRAGMNEMARMRAARMRNMPSTDLQLHTVAVGGYIACVVSLGMFGATFCLVFALVNPLLQATHLFPGEFNNQLGDGTLLLRVSTVFFAATFLWKMIAWVRREDDSEFEDILGKVPTCLSEDARWARDVAQSTVFLVALSTLWFLYSEGVTSPLTAVLAYAFAFFSDDWGLISDCSRVVKGRLLRWHRRRLHIANILLLAPLLIIAWQEFHLTGLLTWLIVVAIVIIARYVVFSESQGRIPSEWRWRPD